MINIKSTFQNAKNSFESTTTSKGFSNTVNSFLSGDFLGSALNVIGTIKGFIDGSAHRIRVTKERIEERMNTFERSQRTIHDLNRLFKDMMDLHNYESTKKGNQEKMVIDALREIELKLTGQGYTYVEKEGISTIRKTPFVYKVWSEPGIIDQAGNAIKQGVEGVTQPGGTNWLALGAIGLGMFTLLKKGKPGKV